MKTIKFSHMYPKLPEITDVALLLQCFYISRKDVSKAFEEYDTKYFDEDLYRDAYYKLPDGMVIVLLFLGRDDTVFTTIRRYTPSKFKYYRDSQGEDFKIEIS